MSEHEEEVAIELPPSGDAAFTALMDFMVEEAGSEETSESTETPGTATGADGQPATGSKESRTESSTDGPNLAGAGGDSSVLDEGGTHTSADSSFSGGGVGTVDASSLAPKWGEISEAIETRFQETYTNTALEEVKTEYGRYFGALEKHPRMLVGEEVPSLQGEGVEVLRDSADAREWQEAVQQLLIAEVKDRAQRGLEDERSTLDVLHGSIELFSNNHDLIPGTKGFNRELAERFTALTKDYEVRVDGKLTGYKVPVQGMIDSIRAQLSREAAAAPPAPAAPAAKKVAKTEPPQAGIPSKAGNSGDGPEDFSTLFGTLGLPNLRI